MLSSAIRSVRVLAAALVLCGLVLMPAEGAPVKRLFISGHSLTDRPLPDMLAAMLAADGRPIDWNRQDIGGSTIRERTEGRPGTPPGSGHAAGVDRDGAPIDIRTELSRQPPYDMLIVTERHTVLDVIAYEGFPGTLKGLVELFLAASPAGTSYFYAPWLGIGSREDPGRWIAFERAADPVWRCAVAGVNATLAAEGKAGRIGFIPAAGALADLVAQMIAAPEAAGFAKGAKPADIVAALFTDDVHLTALGFYFVALVTYGVAFDGDVAAAPMPAGIDPVRGEAMRRFAAAAVAAARAAPVPADCKGMPQRFIADYVAYSRWAYGSRVPGMSWLQRRKAEAALKAALGD